MCIETVEGVNGPFSLHPLWEQVVDASKSIEDVHKEIRVLSEDAILTATHRPLGELWK
jgi:hypothetical protein